MENNNQNQKKGFNKLLIIIPILVVLTICAFLAIKFLKPNNDTVRIELKQDGVYANYISAAIDYYEKTHGRSNIFRYGNVISEYMNTRDQMAQSNISVPILKYVVLLVYEEDGELIARNYLCEVTKGEFEKIVIRNTPKETNFIESAVNASDKVTKNRSKTGSIDFDIKTGEIELTPAVKIGAFGLKTDIGKIYDALGDTAIGSAAGIEEVFNQIRNSEIKENEIVEKMTDAAYFYAVAYYSRFIYQDKGIGVKPIKKEELFKYYLDEKEKDAYQKLINDNEWVFATSTENESIESNYDRYLKENGIVKNSKHGFATHFNKNVYFKNFKIEIPEYFKKYKDEQSEIGYSTNLKNNNDVTLVIINDKIDVGNVKTVGNNDIERLLNGVVSSLNGNQKFEIDSDVSITANSNVNGRLYSLMSETFYSEVFTFNDYDENANIFVVLIEYLNGGVEYKDDFKEIFNNIKRIQDNIKIDSREKLLKNNKGDLVDNVESYFKSKGFTNVRSIPKYDALNERIAKTGAMVIGTVPAIKDYVYDIHINGRSFDGSQTYRENDKVEIFYHEDKKNKNANSENIYSVDIVEIPEPDLSGEIVNKQYEKENRINSRQTLSIEEIEKVKLVTEYSDDAVIDEIDTIKFGKYPQDSRDEDVKQDIEWIVLDRKDGKALLLSKYILDCKKYDELDELERLIEKASKNIEEYEKIFKVVAEKFPEINDMSSEEELVVFMEQQDDEDSKKFLAVYKEYKYIQDDLDKISITWNDSSMRKWLNESFTNIAFSNSEKESIVESNIKNFDNFEYKTKGGESTEDKVFCLSIDEIEKYFGDINDSNSKLITKGTKYARTIDNDGYNLLVKEENSPYWLRTPGLNGHQVMSIFEDGTISNQGEYANFVRNGVRPAMWVKY